ncbi:hypothetical protein HDU81_007687, partial [Chytriomyces hyalinus]
MDDFDIYADLDAHEKEGLNDSTEALEKDKWEEGCENAMAVTQDLLLIQQELGLDYAAQPAQTTEVQSIQLVTAKGIAAENVPAVADPAA